MLYGRELNHLDNLHQHLTVLLMLIAREIGHELPLVRGEGALFLNGITQLYEQPLLS